MKKLKHISLLGILVLNTFISIAQSIPQENLSLADTTFKSSGLEKYGFKSLFTNNNFKAGIPYDSQVNPEAIGFIQDYLAKYGDQLEKMKSWAVMYFMMIDKILVLHNLPKELKYLAVIESNLKSNATSWVGAKGPWQFMPGTAITYGLQVNKYADERTDYIKSTHAAAKYLLALYNDLNDWLLVIAAYNGGPARVYNAIKKSGSRDFWKLQYYLPLESRNHVKKFIATHYIMEGKGSIATSTMNDHTINDFVLNDSNLVTQKISGRYMAGIIAKNISMDWIEFNNLNPGMDAAMMATENSYDMRLPKEKMELFNSNKTSILTQSVETLLNSGSTQNSLANYPTIDKLPVSKKTKKKKGG